MKNSTKFETSAAHRQIQSLISQFVEKELMSAFAGIHALIVQQTFKRAYRITRKVSITTSCAADLY